MKFIKTTLLLILIFLFNYNCFSGSNVIIKGPVPRFKKVQTGIGLNTKPKVDPKTKRISTEISTSKIEGPSYSPFSAKTNWIYDGDSFKVKTDDNKTFIIRLFGIDAPEGKQPYGKASTKNLIKLIKNKQVYIQPITKDKYKRFVAKVYLINKKDKKIEKKYINLQQIKDGYAWHYKRYAKNEKQFAEAEMEARKAKKGLWVQDKPEKPETYRIRIKKLRKNPKLH